MHGDDDAWDDEIDDWADDDDETCTIACSECGADVYEDAVRCPECGFYLSPAHGAMAGRPTWWYWVGAAVLVAIVFAFVLR